MPPKTRSKESLDSSHAASDKNSSHIRKRSSANFSTILTSLTPQRTSSQTEVIARKYKAIAEEYRKNPSSFKDGDTKSNVRELIKKFDQIKPERKTTKTVKVASATSQNHIISDKYLGAILEKAIVRIRQYITSGNQTKVGLAERQEKAVQVFFEKIFHYTENKELQNALRELQKYLRPDGKNADLKLLQGLCSDVAAKGSNNAVEGDASANSGIGEDMDAPLDLQGRLLPPFETMRDNFLELCNIVSLFIKDDNTIGRDQKLQELTLQAISPNLIGDKIRFSSKAYKGDIGDGKYYESPSFLENSVKNFRVGDLINPPKITSSKKSLTAAQLKHFKEGLIGYRSYTPTTSRKVNYYNLSAPIQDADSSSDSHSSPNLSPILFPNDDYADDKLNQLFRLCLAPDTRYVEPTIALAEGQLNEVLDNFIASAVTKLVIAIHADHHYMGIFIEKKDGEFSITYFDPTVSYEDEVPLHNIPNNIQQSLTKKFPNVQINSISSAIQSYSVEADNIIIDNNHCGPFVCYFISLIANGNARLSQDGSNRIQIKLDNNEWKNIDVLSSTNSNEMGNKIRGLHDDIIEKQEAVMNSTIVFNFTEDQPSSAVSVKDVIKKFEKLNQSNKEKSI